MTNTNTAAENALSVLQGKLDHARRCAAEAHVPDSDFLNLAEPVTLSGWYRLETVSGRPAWASCQVRDGQVVVGTRTYNPDAEKALDEVSLDHYEATRRVARG